MNDVYIIYLKEYTSPKETALIGRENGQKMLSRLKKRNVILTDIEKSYKLITIIIPDNIITMNKSYFLGLFSTRVKELGKEKFLEIYNFDTNDYIINKIKSNYVDSAMLTASMEEILNA